jgi:hypothetical protein
MKLTTHHNLVPRLGMTETIALLFIHAFMACIGINLPENFQTLGNFKRRFNKSLPTDLSHQDHVCFKTKGGKCNGK